MVEEVLAELHDFRGADSVETSDWVLQVSVCFLASLACRLRFVLRFTSVSATRESSHARVKVCALPLNLFPPQNPFSLLRICSCFLSTLQVTVREHDGKVSFSLVKLN